MAGSWNIRRPGQTDILEFVVNIINKLVVSQQSKL